jgi:hypothetical protein
VKKGSSTRSRTFPRHSRTGVADRDLHVLTGDQFLGAPAVRLVEKGVAGCDRQLAAFRHGVAGIDGEIEDGGLQLDRIGFDLPQAVGGHDVQSDRLAERATQEIGEAVKERIDAEGFWIKRLLARKHQQALGDCRGPLSAAHGVVDDAA